MTRLVIAYQKSMEGRPSPCRFTPSCSSYAVEALDVHGTWRGLWLTVRRLLRCRPFGPSGFDPVPLPGQTSDHSPDHSPDRTRRSAHRKGLVS
ncbi:MAG: membrane protein insertion efficiency factor YidD [Actinomycetota bacterium]